MVLNSGSIELCLHFNFGIQSLEFDTFYQNEEKAASKLSNGNSQCAIEILESPRMPAALRIDSVVI